MTARIEIECKTRKVWRAPHAFARERKSVKAAYRDAAWFAWKTRHPCECEFDTGWVCGEHRTVKRVDPVTGIEEDFCPRAEYRRKVLRRLAGWLYWRDFGEHGGR